MAVLITGGLDILEALSFSPLPFPLLLPLSFSLSLPHLPPPTTPLLLDFVLTFTAVWYNGVFRYNETHLCARSRGVHTHTEELRLRGWSATVRHLACGDEEPEVVE